ncbi:MAG: electron transport complex subunit RsxE [Planctomycetes bacterium]|nr:electron transport complex subunit RsxE [Planctomycetota bacterium]
MPPPSKPLGDEFLKGLWKENPIFIQVLGMCPALAVTNSVVNALAMGLATCFVLVCSSFFVSSLRRFIPRPVRISTYIVIIATFVTLTDLVLAALVPDVHRALGAFIPLIVVNCLILGRQEAFASKNPVPRAVADAAGMGVGFAFALTCLGAIREILGAGTFLGVPLFGPHFEPWVIMLLPPGGFLSLGFLLLFFNALKQARDRRRAAAARGETA